ncbi:MAG TPA: carboxypeptidase regulatory-like domain-containing protein [Pyrinomonadaceae bacterium]
MFSFLILLVVLTDGRSSIVSSATAQGETSTPPSVTVSLRSFGAVGDGLNDDAPALQRALDSLAQSALGGDATLVVPAGRYALMTPVAKNFENRINSLNIIGEIPFDVPESEGPGRGLGLSSEFIVRLGDADALSISSLSNVHIRDVVFIGDLAVSNDARIVLGLSEIGNATVRHCEFYGLASLTANGALIYAHHSRLNLEDSAFLGCTANAGFNTSVVQNTLWRGITVSNTRFIDYGNRPDYFSKTPYAVPLSWISIGNAAAHDEESAWREAIIRDVFLDEGGYIGLTCRPDLFAPYIPGGGPIDLVHISGLRMNVSNLDAHGLQLAHANRLMIERSFFGWSQNADTAITMSDIGEAIIDQSECAVDATTIRAEASVGRLDVVNSIYQTLDSLAQVTNVVNTTPDADPVQHVRQQFLALVAREADPAAFFYWSNQILRCGNAAQCVADKKLALNNYLNTHPSATFDISGRVTGDDDAGLPGVTMTLTGSAASTAVTDNEGRYRFARLPTSGVYTVTPSKTYYTFNAPSQTLTTPNGQRVADFRGAINRYSINGQVTTQSGAPLAGATVALSGSRTASVVTGNDGTYRFDALPAGGTYTLTPSKVNRTFQSPATLTFQNLTANQTAQSFVAVTVNYQISGRVTTPGGTPLSGTRVDLTGTGTGAAFTDANGNYSFVVQAEGSYTLRPTRANYGFTPAFLSFNNLSKNETANFNALLNNYNISGTVTLNGSVPLSGVRMVLSGGQTGEMFTGDDGSYFFTVKADGTYTVKPSLDGHSFRSATTGLSSETISGINRHHAVNFIGKSSHIISGKITTAGGGAVGGVSVSLSGTQSAAAATTDADGNYSIVARAMGNYTVTPSKTNYDFTSQTLSFNQLEADQTANFTGAKNRHSIAGRIANASGAALANATVTLSGAQNKTATTNADGRYSFDELQPVGTYVVAVSKNNYSFNIANRTFNGLNTDQTADFTGALVSYTIGGRITTSDGARLGGVAIILSGSQSGSTMTDADGNYSFTVTAEGNYTLTPSKSHFTFNSPSLSFNNLSAHQSADFLATLNRHSISGRVTNTDGNPIAGVLLTLSGAQSSTATTDASGNYSFASLPAGNNYTVMARRANYTFNVESRTVNELGVNESVDFVGTLVDYSISGRVVRDDGLALDGVAVTLTGSANGTATTDADGRYSFKVKAEGSYTLMASRANHTFAPANRSFNLISADQTADFLGALNTYNINGIISDGLHKPLGGVRVVLSGDHAGETLTNEAGVFSFNVKAEGSYTLTPSKTNYTFSPTAQTFARLGEDKPANFSGNLIQLLQFGEAVYSVSEGAGTVQFNVVRIGETSGAAQVNYATLSGTASDRSDYSAAFGTLQFAPGEASKTVNIFITDDAYLENAETFSVALSNLTGATFGAASTATVTIGNNDAADAPNPVKWDAGFNSEFFVRQHYIDFFNREADSDGLSFWRGQINGCGANVACAESRRANVSAAFFVSIENHETGYLVYRFHHAAYGRRIAGTVPLTFREFLTDVKQIGRGVVVNVGNWKEQLAQNKQAYADAFVNRTEFLALYPLTMSAEAFVDALNANTGASLSQAERDALVGRLQANQTTRAQALMEVAEDAEFQRRESNRAFVLMQYFGYLRRNPDDAPDGNMAGFNFWLQKLNNHNGNYISAEMVKAFLTSPEYIGRFGQ